MAEKGEACMYTREDREAIKRAERISEIRVQDNAVLGDQTVYRMDQQMQVARQEEQVVPAQNLDLFMKETKKMKDSAKLGWKTPGFKTDTEEKKQRNEKIERSKMYTQKATADTEYVYMTIAGLKEKRKDRPETEDEKSASIEYKLYLLEQYRFEPEMYYSSNIKANLKEYLLLVRDFDYVYNAVIGTEQTGIFWERIVKIHPVYSALKKRLQVYCEQNRIHLNGKIMKDHEKGATLTERDRLDWYKEVKIYNQAKEAEDRYWEELEYQAEVAEEEERAEAFRKLFKTEEEQEELEGDGNQAEVLITDFETEEEETEQEETEQEREENIILNIEVEVQKQFKRADDIEKELVEKKENGEDTTAALEENRDDKKRLEQRRKKDEIGIADVQTQMVARDEDKKVLQMTREDALGSYSDIQSNNSRERLRNLNNALWTVGSNARRKRDKAAADNVANAVNKYVEGTRYTVGYTEERDRLKNAIKAVEKAYESLKEDLKLLAGDEKASTQEVFNAIVKIRNYFNEMTNGTLPDVVVDDDNDYTSKPIEEIGETRGGTRNYWIRKLSHWSNQEDTPLFAHEPTINDLKQHFVSNCYMLASVTGLVNLEPQLIKQCIRENEDHTVTVRLYEVEEQEVEETPEPEEKEVEKTPEPVEMVDKEPPVEIDGQNEVLRGFWEGDEDLQKNLEKAKKTKKHFHPIYVKVKKEIPRIAGIDALSAGALWMQMIEKACACVGKKVVVKDKKGNSNTIDITGYQSLWYGEGGEFLERLLGVTSKVVPTDDKNALFDALCEAREKKCIYNAGTKDKVGKGLSAGHAYAILGAEERDGDKYVLLRNPYSTNSLKYCGENSRGQTGWGLSYSSDETYGQFYIKLDDFCKEFTNVTCTDVSKLL